MITDQKKEQVRVLSDHLKRICKEYIEEKKLLEQWAITDPEKLDQYYKLFDLLGHHASLYLQDIIPWNNDSREEIEVIQVASDETPVAVKVRRYENTPTVMQTARDILIFAVLP